MKQTTENRKQLVSAGIWSLAVLALLAVGMMTFFSAASRKDKPAGEEETTAVTENTQIKVPDTEGEETEDAGFFKPANPLDTDAVTELMPAPETKAAEDAAAEADTDADVPTASFDNGEDFRAVMPVAGSVTKTFTEDVAVYSLTMNDYRVPSGIDIYAPVGTNVGACAAGVIERVWEDPFLGQCVEINHGGEIRSQYANLSADLPRGIEAGATVLAGDIIGGVGETMIIEMADTDHLHFSMTVDGVAVDPLDYITNYRGDTASDYDE